MKMDTDFTDDTDFYPCLSASPVSYLYRKPNLREVLIVTEATTEIL
jgi:hypothetical protein